MTKKIVLSFFCGLLILVITWIYQNYDFTISKDDDFLKKVFFVKDKIYSPPPKYKTDFVFINTGKDLALIEDTIDYGTVAVSDREKIYRFVHYIDSLAQKPLFTVLDIQFYFPYTLNPQIDTLLEKELSDNKNILIPLLKDENGEYKQPLYKAVYAYSDYRMFKGNSFNKFRILNHEDVSSIPIVLDREVNKAVYKDYFWFATSNNHLCLSSIWPSYYLKNDDIKNIQRVTGLENIKTNPKKKEKIISAQYYNIGEILLDMEVNPAAYSSFFKDKIVFVGNFEGDVHSTPVGKLSGPVLLANIYLSLLNKQHIISISFLISILIAFTALSYVALYKEIPELKFKFKFLFSSRLVNFIRKYVSYFGCMFLLSVLVLILFNVQVAFFLPSLLFTAIEYIRHKKYRSELS